MSEMSVDELENLTHLLAFPRDWQILPIESLCLKVTSGGTPSRKNPESDGVTTPPETMPQGN